jgi:hypothetical protein
MARKKREDMSDDDILAKIEQKIKAGVSYSESKLAAERERVIKYYNSQLPAPITGGSPYVSTDVYDSVEAMKAQLLETFSGNQNDLISFPPQGEDDVEPSRIATEYCSYVVFRENDGYSIFNDTAHDGLTCRHGIVKVFWEKDHETQDEEFKGLDLGTVEGIASQEEVSDLDAELDEDTGLFEGTLTRTFDKSQVAIVPIPNDEFGISKNAKTIKDADICWHRTVKTKADLKAMGYDAKKVDALNSDEDVSAERQARAWMLDQGSLNDEEPLQGDMERLWFYEAYCKLNLGKGRKLYKFCFASNTLFDRQEVYCAPFKVFTPLPVPHLFIGNNFAARVIPTQNARTTLTRAILEHTVTTTNPRWTVLRGGLTNPKEMIDNRKGGLVNINRPDALSALEQPNLNPFVFQTIEMLKSNKEESTGISSLSQGLNKEAISTQNSQGLVSDLVTLSQQRQKIIARNFAKFLIEVYLEVYRLVLENEKKEKIIEVAGNWVKVDPRSWIARTTCKASVNLGYGDREKETQKYVNTAGILQQGAGPMFTDENKYNLYVDGLKSAGFKDYARYITHPAKVPPPGPSVEEMELQVKDKQAEASMVTAKATEQKVQNTAAFDAIRAQMEELTETLNAMIQERDADRKDAEVANRIEISRREMALAENPPAETEGRSIISPSG